MSSIVAFRRLWLAAPLVLAACASSPDQDRLAAQAADIAALKQEIARRDGQVAELEQNLGDLRRALDELKAETVIPAPLPAPEKPPEAAPLPTVPPEGEFAIHLASYGSAAMAAEGWTSLVRQHADLVAGLEPRFTTLNIDDTVYYRLIAGRFDSHGGAREACDRIKAATGYCVVTFFGGDALP